MLALAALEVASAACSDGRGVRAYVSYAFREMGQGAMPVERVQEAEAFVASMDDNRG